MKLEITTHDGKHMIVDVENYNAVQLNESLNNNELNTVVIGDIILSRINVKSITPAE